jgi:hypothetical protein
MKFQWPLLEYAFGMAERAEPFDSMVCAYTARTDPVAGPVSDLTSRDLDRRGVRVAAFSRGAHDASEHGLV